VQSARSIAKNLLAWFGANARNLPWRRTRDPYAIWISEVMLQQTQVKTVVPYWERWMTQLPDVQALAEVTETQLFKLWEGLGYYSRARNLQRAAIVIVKEHGGEFPRNFEALLALPGIGRYTAGAICSIAFNKPYPVLDGNVMRVLTRLFGISGNPKERRTNERLWQLAHHLVQLAHRLESDLGCSHLNQSLMELGATTCVPKSPCCQQCPVHRHCAALKTNRVDRLPNVPTRVKATPRRFIAFVVGHRDRFLVRQRPGGVVNARLWEFPNVEVTDTGAKALKTIVKRSLGVPLAQAAKLCTIRHSITRYRITVDVFSGRVSHPTNDGQWLTLQEIDARALASAHRKILDRFRTQSKDRTRDGESAPACQAESSPRVR
jgi:A/G-specific adenine glycosylase